ncbi:hypothetical protein [Litorimonas haliclonae]|uniref:hypothetical protein n=1 Tax=Litorimonas haliclonae TaxID=2081977 RepID=UPI0039EF1838
MSKQLHIGLMASVAAALFAGTAFAGNSAGPAYTPDLLPANPNAGECYARVEIPAQYEHGSETVLTEEGYQTLQVLPPELATRQKDVLVKEASVRYQVRQPTYKSVSEQLLVRPSYDKLTVSAPQFSTVTETIQTSAPQLVWKRGNPGKLRAQGYIIHSTADGGPNGQGYSSTTQYGTQGGAQCGEMCEIWCLVEEPGQSVSYKRKVMTNPGGVQRVSVPAKYQTITKQVVADPGGVTEIPVPAEYRSYTVEDVVREASGKYVDVPAKWGQVQTKTLVAPSRYEWRRVLCAPGSGTIRPSASYSHSETTSSYTSKTHHDGVMAGAAPTHHGSHSSSHQSRTYSGPVGNTAYTHKGYKAPYHGPKRSRD